MLARAFESHQVPQEVSKYPSVLNGRQIHFIWVVGEGVPYENPEGRVQIVHDWEDSVDHSLKLRRNFTALNQFERLVKHNQ